MSHVVAIPASIEQLAEQALPPEGWRRLYPFRSHYLSLEPHAYHYLDEGRGPAVVLVHGNPTWSFYYRNLVLALRERYRVIVPDHLGCGLSDKPRSYPYTLDQHANNLGKLLDHLQISNATLIAHDWGGAIGMRAATQQPQRFSRFVLMNTAAFRGPKIPLRIRVCRTPLLGKLAVCGLNAFLQAAFWMALVHRERMTGDIRAGYLAPYDCWANRVAIHRFVMDIPMQPSHCSYQALVQTEAGLSQFKGLPVLLLWGMKDWCFTPWYMQKFKELLPLAEMHPLPNAGHWLLEDEPQACIEAILDFLGRPPASLGNAENKAHPPGA